MKYENIFCSQCSSDNLIKNGTILKDGLKSQRYHCKNCGEYFTHDPIDESEREVKQKKKELVLMCLERGIKDAREIWEYWANRKIIIDIHLIRRYIREKIVSDRVDQGLHFRGVERPFAVSGITGNSINNKYLDGISSATGGFLKTAVYDIETTSLMADFGYVLTATFKDVDTGEIKVFRLDETPSFTKELDDYKNGKKSNWNNPNWWDTVDMELLEYIRKEFNSYNLVITWNGIWFDNRFIETRLLRCGLDGLDSGVKHMDMLMLARRVMQVRSKKLDAVKNFLKIDEELDTHEWGFWRMAQAGIKEGFDFITEHNIKDVEQLHQTSQKLRKHTKAWFF